LLLFISLHVRVTNSITITNHKYRDVELPLVTDRLSVFKQFKMQFNVFIQVKNYAL